MSQRTSEHTMRLVRPAKDQPAHPRRLIRVFADRICFILRALQRGINENPCYTGGMYGLPWVSVGHTGFIVGFVVCWHVCCKSQSAKTYLRTCAPNEDSDQPARSRSLIRIFIGRVFITKCAKFLHAKNKLWSDARMRRLIWVLAESICLIVRFLRHGTNES